MTYPAFKILTLAIVLQALSPIVAAQTTGELSFDKVWSYATLYDNKDNRFIQKFDLSGRLQIDQPGLTPIKANLKTSCGDVSASASRPFYFRTGCCISRGTGISMKALGKPTTA